LQPALVGQILFPNCHSIWILAQPIFQTSRKTVRSRYFAVGFGSTAAAHAIALRCFSNCNQLQKDD
jgi:hypothetical protein